MTLPAKTFVLMLVMGCTAPVWAASAKTYIKETVAVRDGGQTFQVVARHTLVEGRNVARYSIRNLFDHNKGTTWVTKFDDSDYDSSVGTFEIDFDKPVYVNSITFQNGYQKSLRLFSANQRVKDLIVFNILTKKAEPVEADLTLKDTMAPQHISAQQAWGQSFHLFKTMKLIFIIDSVYPGTRYTDLCLSNLTIHYTKGIDYTPTRTWKNLQLLIEQNKTKTLHGWDWGGFDNTAKYPEAFSDFLYYVVTGNKEAYALFRTYAPDGAADSEDMDNYFRDAVKESLSSDEMKREK